MVITVRLICHSGFGFSQFCVFVCRIDQCVLHLEPSIFDVWKNSFPP